MGVSTSIYEFGIVRDKIQFIAQGHLESLVQVESKTNVFLSIEKQNPNWILLKQAGRRETQTSCGGYNKLRQTSWPPDYLRMSYGQQKQLSLCHCPLHSGTCRGLIEDTMCKDP